MEGVIKCFGHSSKRIDQWAKAHNDEMAFTPRQIVEASAPKLKFDHGQSFCGVYFLIRNRKICYIGKSINVIDRLKKHTKNKRPFDAVTVITGLPIDLIGGVEHAFQSAWRLPWNYGPTVHQSMCDDLERKLSAMKKDFVCTLRESAFTPEELAEVIARLD
jgi:hypothetical protein